MTAGLPRVALLIESSRTYGRGILRGIARYAHVNGPWSIYSQERELHSGIPDWLKNWDGDGIIARIEDRRMASALLRLGHPIVDVLGNNRFDAIPGFDTDAHAVAQLAAEFFVRTGFRNLAYCGYRGIPFSDRREAAFCEFLVRQGRKVCVFSSRVSRHSAAHIQAVEQSGLGAEKAIAQWLREQPRPLGLFACNDVRAQQVLNACREHGLKAPEEVAVIGVDNDDVLCNLCVPSLSSIEPDTERLGYEAAALLDRLMKRRPVKSALKQIPPVGLVERGSTDVLPIEDAIAVQALRFIRDRLAEGIAVKDVLKHVGRSRTDLEQRFRRWLRTSICQEILRQRMDRACSLLQQTDLDLEAVAARSGLVSAAQLCRLFRRRFQCTPTAYRTRC